jgi:hypothetical protein
MALSALAALADSGGGRRVVSSPWPVDPPRNAAEVERVKVEAAKLRTLQTAGDVRLSRVALRLEPARDSDTPAYALTGRLASGKKATLSFSEIDHFDVLSLTATTARLSVTIWPDISAAKLLADKPTFTALRAGYRRVVELEIPLRSKDGRALVFGSASSSRTLSLSDLAKGAKVSLWEEDADYVEPRQLWWATPSVTADPTFRYTRGPTRAAAAPPRGVTFVTCPPST